MSKKPHVIHISLFGVLFFLLTVFAGYGAYKLWPIYKKKNDLENMIRLKAFQLKRNEPERVRVALVETAKKQLDITLLPQDIDVRKFDTYVQVDVTWRPEVRFLKNKVMAWPMTFEERVGIYD